MITLFSVCYAVYLIIKNEWIPFISLLGIGFMLAPVLTMGNMQHKLYLYIPSVFVGLYFASIFSLLQNKIKNLPHGTFALIFVLVLTATNYTSGAMSFRNWWCNMTAQDSTQIEQLYRMGSIPEYCNIYVRGADRDYNAIYPYGPGDCFRFIYDRNDINCFVVDEFPEQPIKPYILIDYNEGFFAEVSRFDSHEVEILNVYSSWDGDNLQIGITCNPIYPDCQILINGNAYPATGGDAFISTAVNQSELGNTDTITIAVNSFDTESETVTYEIPPK